MLAHAQPPFAWRFGDRVVFCSVALVLHAQFGMADWNVNVGSNINSAPVVVNDPLLDFGAGPSLRAHFEPSAERFLPPQCTSVTTPNTAFASVSTTERAGISCRRVAGGSSGHGEQLANSCDAVVLRVLSSNAAFQGY